MEEKRIDKAAMPIGLAYSLAADPAARVAFSAMSAENQDIMIEKARRAGSKDELNQVIDSITRGV